MGASKVFLGSGLAFERSRMGRSTAVWHGGGGSEFGVELVREDSNLGFFVHEHFIHWVGGAVASNKGNYNGSGGPWHSWEGTGASIVPTTGDFGITSSAMPTNAQGVIELATSATQFKTAALEPIAGANGASFAGAVGLPSTATATAPVAGQLPKLYFEARVRFVQTANMAMFLGFSVPGATASDTVVFSGSAAYTKQAAIGFVINPVATTGLLTSGSKIQPMYATATAITTPTVGKTGGIPSSADYVGQGEATVVAGSLTDFTKLGFVFDATRPDGGVLRYYQDGLLLAQQTISQITAANWPSDVQLTPTVCVMCATAANDKLDIDWIDYGQIYATE